MGQGSVGPGLPHPEAGARPAGVRRLRWAAHLLGGELRRSVAGDRVDAGRSPRPPLRPDARPRLLAHGAAGGLTRRPGTQIRARVVLVNRGKTPYDRAATLRVWRVSVSDPACGRAGEGGHRVSERVETRSCKHSFS